MVRFSTLLPFKSPKEQELLMEEFLDFQLLGDKDIPQDVWDKATVVEEEDGQRYHRLDVLWYHLLSMRGPDNALRFPWLSKISRLVLTVPHPNTQEERIFSMMRKNKTAFWSSLDLKGTLSSILTIKLAHTEPSHTFDPPKELLRKDKSATTEYNKEHSKSKKWPYAWLPTLPQFFTLPQSLICIVIIISHARTVNFVSESNSIEVHPLSTALLMNSNKIFHAKIMNSNEIFHAFHASQVGRYDTHY